MKNLLLLRFIFLFWVCVVGFQCVILLSRISTTSPASKSSILPRNLHENNQRNPVASGFEQRFGREDATTIQKRPSSSTTQRLEKNDGSNNGRDGDWDDSHALSSSSTSSQLNNMRNKFKRKEHVQQEGRRKKMTRPQPPGPPGSSRTKPALTLTESVALQKMMIKTQDYSVKNNVVITKPGRQGFHLPKELLEWNLLKPKHSSSNTTNLTRTICVAEQNRYIGPTQTVQDRFYDLDGWKFLLKPTDNKSKGKVLEEACSQSLIRLFYERSSMNPDGKKYFSRLKLKHLTEHLEGRQLSGCILGGSKVDKGSLATMISSSTLPSTSILKDAIPQTHVFHSLQSCSDFCENVWNASQQRTTTKQQQWIWKPKFSSYGRGIVGIGPSLKQCHEACSSPTSGSDSGGWNNAAAQRLVTNPLTLPLDNRKFDIRSHIFVASVNPLIVFTGAEYVRICAEPLNTPTEEPFLWNEFQQVCNMAVSKQLNKNNNIPQQHPSTFVRPLGEQSVLENEELYDHILQTLDQHDRALVNLLYQERWTNPTWMNPEEKNGSNDQNRNKIGMFQMMAADYLVANSSENEITLLELNSQPGFTGGFGVYYTNPWGDAMLVEWTILKTYNEYKDSEDKDWKNVLDKRLSELELETLRRLEL